jgi:hypothetical protein
MPEAAVTSALLREAVAQMATQAHMDAKDIIQPGGSGHEGLRAVDFLIKGAGIRPIVVMDNVHRVTPGTIQTVVTALKSCRFVLLGQPTPGTAEVEARLGAPAVSLQGWSLLTIAAEFASAHAALDPARAERVRQLTGGFPDS